MNAAPRLAVEPSVEEQSAGVLRIYSFLDPAISFSADIQEGLSSRRKMLPARWRYDESGIRALLAQALAPEYYLFRSEQALLREHSGELATAIGPNVQLIEIGPAAGIQVSLLIEALQPPLYLNIGVDRAAAQAVAARLAMKHPRLHIAGILSDPTAALVLPGFSALGLSRKLLFLSALATGSYTPDGLSDVLRQARRMAGRDGLLIAAFDLKKSRKLLETAANDARGLAARLNVGLLHRINRELGGDFQIPRFRHIAVQDEVLGCTGFYLESDYAQFVRIGGRRFDFEAGEVMLTGISSQYATGEFEALAVEAGFVLQKTWTDASRRVAMCLLAGH